MPTTRKPRSPRRKPTGALKTMIESKKAPTTLLGDIQQHAVKRAQEETDRRQDIIHPSEMAKEDWCPRQTVFRIRGVQPSNPTKLEGYRMLTIFQEGHDIHSKWQTWLGEMGRLWGRWACPVCGHDTMHTGAPYCTVCKSEYGIEVLMQYKEVPLNAEDAWLIHGHADGGVPDIESFIEIKSIGLGTLRMEEPELVRQNTVKTEDGKKVVDYDSIWKALKRPLKSHRKQAAIYLAIARHLGWPYERMVFIYENKANQDTKEFSVPLDEELANELIDLAKDVKWAVEKDKDLPRPGEFTKDKKPCRECPWLTWCWAGEEEDEQDRDVVQEGSPAGGGERVHPSGRTPRVQALPERTVGPRQPRSAAKPRVQRERSREASPEQVRDDAPGVRGNARPTGRGVRVVRRRATER